MTRDKHEPFSSEERFFSLGRKARHEKVIVQYKMIFKKSNKNLLLG